MPGSLQEKVDPYLRPLYDALYDLLDQEKVDKLLERNVIEVAPLAFMRGRTLNDAFIIMDEAQNTTNEQMKMFVTRLGNNSKAVITGDLTQIDLPNPKKSGLLEALHVLDGVEGIRFCHFEDVDARSATTLYSVLFGPTTAMARLLSSSSRFLLEICRPADCRDCTCLHRPRWFQNPSS